MGEKKQKLQKFIQQHPLCCFCGGRASTTTQDHLPPRSIFVEKKWPEGYVFPACEACNVGSSRDDAMVAFLSRWNAGREPTETESREWQRLLAAFKEHHPAAVREMLMSANQKRRWMTARRFSTSPHYYSYLYPRPEPIDHRHKPFNAYTTKISITNAGKIASVNTGQILCPSHSEPTFVQGLDYFGCECCLELAHIGISSSLKLSMN